LAALIPAKALRELKEILEHLLALSNQK
jgi:hypothetical protein